jgi:phage shock protein E
MAIHKTNRTVRAGMRRVLGATLAAVLCGIGSCSSPPPADSVQNVTAAEAGQLIQTNKTNGGNLVILDVRSPAEFAPEHIEGAANVCLECGDTFAQDIQSLDKNAEYLVYCHSGRRSAMASNTMAQAGFTTVYNMTGGILAWEGAGYPVVGAP